MKILCIGHAAYDITIPVESFPVENTKNRVHDLVECGGGPSSNAAYLLGKWGMDVSFAGIVGNDEYGRRIKTEFDRDGVNTQYLEISNNYKTPSSFIIANKGRGTRTVLTYRPNEMQMQDINLDFIPDIILMDGQEPVLSKKIIKMFPRAISIIDAGRPTPEIIELSKMVNYLVCSKDFAEAVTKMKIDYNQPETITILYRELENIFHNFIVITLEANGSLYKRDNLIKIMPSIKVIPVDSTGAGDIFHGAFTYGIANRLDFEKILKIANVAGALSVTKIGGRYSAPSKEEMKNVLNDFE